VLKTTRTVGYVMVAGGALILLPLLLPPLTSAIVLGLVIATILVMLPLSYFGPVARSRIELSQELRRGTARPARIAQ
jgi:hypothetical protein